MKLILFATLLFTTIGTTLAQDQPYLEVLPLSSGWYYRTASNQSFKHAGIWGRNLKPYLQENEVSLRSFKRFQRNSQLLTGASALSLTGVGLSLVGLSNRNFQQVRTGTAMNLGGLIVTILFSQDAQQSMYNAIDSYNFDKRPQNATPLMPKVQFSNTGLGVGLFWSW